MPPSAGHSFSFTKDGFWEEALFQWGNDRELFLTASSAFVYTATPTNPLLPNLLVNHAPTATYPHCVSATLLWQHGNFSLDPLNGTLRMDPFWGDGFQTQWVGCDTTASATTNNTQAPVASYNQYVLKTITSRH